MTQGGDAAEQIVRLSLEGMEVAVKISGESAKNIALILMAVLREEHKTKGKARLSSMIRSGKELKVFSVQNKDLEKFAREAKRYGVLYCVLKDKGDRSSTGAADIIARAEDAAKIQRIVDRFGLSKVDRGSAVSEIRDERKKQSERSPADDIIDDVLKDAGKEKQPQNPGRAETGKSRPSLQNSGHADPSAEGTKEFGNKPSVRDKLAEYKVQDKRSKEPEKSLSQAGKKKMKTKER